MRLVFLLVCTQLLSGLNLLAQTRPSTISKTGNSKKIMYRFPVFKEGTVIYRDGIIYSAKLNYNIAVDEIRLINQQGDTIPLADPVTISFISISPSRFYYDHGYLQTIPVKSDVVLAFKEMLLSTQKNETGSDAEQSLNTTKHYFFGDAAGHFSKASKKYVLEHFQKNKLRVERYLNASHINFDKEKDLINLLEYCGRLQ